MRRRPLSVATIDGVIAVSASLTTKDPAGPALPDASRLPDARYHPVLTGQPALVTGANSGIGKAVARGRARAGADRVVN